MKISELDLWNLEDGHSKEYWVYTKEHTTTPYKVIADDVEKQEGEYFFYEWEDGRKKTCCIFNRDFVNYILIKNV